MARQFLNTKTILARLVAEGDFDILVGDPTLWRIVGDFEGTLVDAPQFAVSGKLGA